MDHSWECERDLANEKVYIRNLKSYGHFAVFALVVRTLQEVRAGFGDPAFTDQLFGQWKEWHPTYYRMWKQLTKASIDYILEAFKKESVKYLRREGEELTYANYFKNQSYVSRLWKAPLGREIRHCTRTVLRA